MSPRHVDALRKINLYASGVVICGVDLNYNFECDWLIELSDNKLPKTKYPITIWQVNWWKKEFFKPITVKEIVIFMIVEERSLQR